MKDSALKTQKVDIINFKQRFNIASNPKIHVSIMKNKV